MGMNLHLSEEELRALLAPQQGEPDAAKTHPPAALQEPALPSALQQDSELLHALKNVMKTLTVRVASLESEVGRLRAELAAVRGDELPQTEKRIVVEGVMLPELPSEREVAAAADIQLDQGTAAVDFAAVPGDGSRSIGLEAVPPAAAVDVALTSRAARHRKPEKKGFFTKLFHK